MKTEIVERKELEKVENCLKHGGVVAFPTDTVYGLGVMWDDEEALCRLKLSKGRPENKPIPMMISSIQQIHQVAYMDEKAEQLAHHFMPGGFTMILRKKEDIPDSVTNGFQTIALRMPDDSFILKLIQKIGKPLLVTSANLSGMPTGVTFEQVRNDFEGNIDMIVKGECAKGVSSTIVDVSDNTVKMIREGLLTEKEILKVWEEAK